MFISMMSIHVIAEYTQAFEGFFPSAKCLGWLCDASSLLFDDSQGLLPPGKFAGPETDHSTPPGAELKNV
jgi:hypothetical protein